MASMLERRRLHILQRAAFVYRYDPACYAELCEALCDAGQAGNAELVFARWRHVDPDNPDIAFLRDRLLGGGVIERAPAPVVEREFDNFAPSFDRVLEKLDYRVPTLLAEILEGQLVPGPRQLDILDLGCGTGLVGAALQSRLPPHRLTGIDLSAGMLDAARQRGLYAELEKADIEAWLQASTRRFDAIVSADALVYLGRLDKVIAGAARCLRSDGLLSLSLEHGSHEDDFRLARSGRFNHSEQYLRRVIQSSGLAVVELRRETIRQELGEPVEGLLLAAVPSQPVGRLEG